MRGATDLLAEVGLPADEIGVAIVARPPVLATTFPIGARAAAALGACGVAAALLWRDRTGQDQVVEVDARRAEVSLVSFALQRLDGAATPRTAEGRPLVALYETADGRWIHLHGAFPRLAARTVQVIGGDVDADAAEVARRVAGFDALAMEDALAAVGACGAMVRSAEEWAAHPQRAAIAPLGRVSIEKIADGPAVAVGDGLRPLGGVRVLDLTRVLAGPACARLLAEHGADVLHVNGEHLDNVPAFVMDTGHGKRSTSLDLRREADVDLLRGLIGDADVFSQGYRSGALERRGFGPAQLAELNPGIIAVTINCYGDTGPWRARPGWEQLGQSVTGIAMAEGASLDPAGRPRLVPAAAADYTTGYLAALGTMAALRRRSIEGGAYHVRASLCQTATWIAEDGPCVDPSTATGLGDITPWLVEERTPFGTLTHLTPVAQLAATPARWATPVVPLGTHPPTWPARQTSIVSRVHELCDACGFDGAAFTDSELLESLRGLGTRWRHQLAAAGVHVRTRPTPTTWSAIEYAAHSRDVTALHAYGVEQALTADEPTFRPISDDVADQVADAYGGADPDEVCVELTSAACRLARVAADAGVDAWTRGLTVGETRSDVRRLLEHALHDSQHHLDDVARGVASLSR